MKLYKLKQSDYASFFETSKETGKPDLSEDNTLLKEI